MDPVDIDLFSVRIERKNQATNTPVISSVLYPERINNYVLESWDFNISGEKSNYYALFPRSWTVYEEPDPQTRLTCKQISPVIAHNYKESSFPVGVFEWTIENLGEEEEEVSIMFTFQNGMGIESDLMGGHSNSLFEQPPSDIEGVVLHYISRKYIKVGTSELSFNDPLSFAIGVLKSSNETKNGENSYVNGDQTSSDSENEVKVSLCPTFIANNKLSTKRIWEQFKTKGEITAQVRNIFQEAERGQTIGTAIVATVTVPPGGHKKIVFSLSWDCPRIRFASSAAYFRRYTEFYGKKGDSAQAIAIDALRNYKLWEKMIEDWQKPILEDQELEVFYKAALFNELYFLVEGGIDLFFFV